MADEKGYPPVHLPAGSVDAQKLHKELETAYNVKDENQHPERVNKAIVNASSDTTREVIASATAPAVPFGAEVVEQEVVYADGQEPVKTQGIAFKAAKDAKSGAEAAEMRYVEDRKGDVVATEEPVAAVPGTDENQGSSLAEVAAAKTGTADTNAGESRK